MESSLENLYNCYLRVTRSSQNKPYKIRKDFSKFDPNKKSFLQTINRVIQQNNCIVDLYFEAPFLMYPNEIDKMNLGLDWYSKRLAFRTYKNCKRNLEHFDCENKYIIEDVKNSFSHIEKTCEEYKYKCIKEYFLHYNGNNILPLWLLDLKDNRISIYALIEFKNNLKVDTDILQFTIPTFNEDFELARQQFIRSVYLKNYIRQQIKLLDEKYEYHDK